MNTKPIPGIAILDIIIFTTIFWMILKKGSKRTNPVADVAAAAATGAGGGHHRGNWAPGWAYLPVMLIRWAIVPHKDWMCEHRHRQEVMDSQLHEDIVIITIIIINNIIAIIHILMIMVAIESRIVQIPSSRRM
eukprot:CAMPEP_0176495654 /NCGR_PEP_ID=MMETSP0200_2-20121128/10776_1 /TAXON_ID=947934 /ORGANISM="Chaetoceros sp., Strain GSL56" /LENGTH=133 /DNA_ID=CAMNT_0017893555 /DNA_START=74 /DNA_END=476 /DNA_ORIENTATION=+